MPYAWDEDFINSTLEEAIEPELPIVDPHHHLWDAPGLQPYLVPQLHEDTGAGHNVVATVFIDCVWDYRTDGPEELRPVGETERAVRAAREAAADGGAQIGGIVSYVDMMLGAGAGRILDAHLEAGDGLFRGIRHATAWSDDPAISRSHTRPVPEMMLTDTFADGVRELAARGLSFDAWLYHDQLTELAALAQKVPDCVLVLDHIGGPLGIGRYAASYDEEMTRWRAGIAEVARFPNVNVKLGGIGMPRFGKGFENLPVAPTSDEIAQVWREPFEFLIEAFGPERCMFESNFPVDRQSTSYVVLWNAFKKIAAAHSPDDKASMFEQTARRVYRVTANT